MGARRGGWPAFGRGRAGEQCASRGSRAAACVRSFWLNLALVLPLGVASIVLYPGCLDKPMQLPPTPRACTDNADCHADEYCDPNAPRVCREIIPDTVPFPDADDVRFGLEGSPGNQTFVFQVTVPPGSVNLARVDFALPSGFVVEDFPIGQIGTGKFTNVNGSITVPVFATGPDEGCAGFDTNGDCLDDEVHFEVFGEGGVDNQVLSFTVSGGADGDLTDNIYDVGGTFEAAIDADLFTYPEDFEGNVVVVFTGVDQDTGDEDDGVEPDPATEEIVVPFDAATLTGGVFTCATPLFDGSTEAHIKAADGVGLIEITLGAIQVPDLGSRVALDELCFSAESRGANRTGEVGLRVFGAGPGNELEVLLGSSPPFPFTVREDQDTVCVKDLGIDTEEFEVIVPTIVWQPPTYDLAPAVDLNGSQRDLLVRTTDGQGGLCQLEHQSPVPLGNAVHAIVSGVEFKEVEEVGVAVSPLVTRLATEPIREASLAVTNLGAGQVATWISGGQSQELEVFAINFEEPRTVTASSLPLDEPAFSLTPIVPLNAARTRFAVGNIGANRPILTTLELVREQGGTVVSSAQQRITDRQAYWEVSLAPACGQAAAGGAVHGARGVSSCEAGVHAVAFRAEPNVFEREAYLCTSGGDCEMEGEINSTHGTELGAINGCPRSESAFFESEDSLVSLYPVGHVNASNRCNDYFVEVASCPLDGTLPFTPGDCDYVPLTGTLLAGDVNLETDLVIDERMYDILFNGACPSSASSSPAQRAGLERDKLPGGAFFFVRNFSAANGSGPIDVATFELDAGGHAHAGGHRSGLEQVQTVGGGFPNLSVDHEPGSDLLTLCFSAVETGAQRVRCSQWRIAGSPDPADWRRVATFLAPPSFNRSSPLAMAGGGIQPREPPPALPITLAGVNAPGAQGPFTLLEHEILRPLPCVEGSDVACLGATDRFAAFADWRTPAGSIGKGTVREVTKDSGVATFFSPDNIELFYKSLDACGLPAFRSKWFFLTGLTNVEVVTTLLDTETGHMRRYANPLNRAFQPVLDTASFTNCPLTTPGAANAPPILGGDAASVASDVAPGDAGALLAGDLATGGDGSSLPDWARDAIAAASFAGSAGPVLSSRDACVPSSSRLCLNNGRFAVEASFHAVNGSSGVGKPVYLTSDTGAFTFFDAANLEVLVKILDACSTGFHSFWVFAAGLTNVEVELTVTDTATGAIKHYSNPQQTPFKPVQDTAAFKTCS